jgi:hypothetical protein
VREDDLIEDLYYLIGMYCNPKIICGILYYLTVQWSGELLCSVVMFWFFF